MTRTATSLSERWRQQRFNPIRGLSPQKLAAALDQFEAGYLRQAALLWDVIEERDDALKINGPKRRKAVARRPWDILKMDDSADADAHAEALRYFYNHVTSTHAIERNVRSGMKGLIRTMMDAIFKRYAVHEIVWRPQPGGLTAEFKFIPLYFFENRTGLLRYTGPEYRFEGDPLEDNGWMVTVGDGIMQAASVCYMFKRLSLQDWVNFSEKFGIPGIHGETPAQKGSQEWNEFVDALDSFANDWVTATGMGAKINLVETSKNGDAPFEPMVERMDRRITALCRGGDLGTLSSEDATGASLQEEEGDILIEDDCDIISETLNTQIDRAVLRYHFGDAEPLAYFRLQPPVRQDVKSDIEVDKHLLSIGGELDAADTYERFGREMPDSMPAGMILRQLTAAPEDPNKPGEDPDNPDRGEETAAENDAVRDIAEAMGVPKTWLAPIAGIFREIEEKASGETLSADEMAAALEAAANRVPELFAEMGVEDLARVFEAGLGAAAIEGVRKAIRKEAPAA